MTYSELKLNILVSTVEEMMQKITMRDEIAAQEDHVALIEEKQAADLKHFPSYPSYHRFDNDFMYALRDNKEISFIDELAEERSVDPICMLDDILPFDDLPKYDQYEENYVLQTEANIVEQSTTGLWEKKVQFQ